MTAMMSKNRSVNLHDFTMVPKRDIPRSVFNMQSTYKTTFDSNYLVPFYVEDIIPGDSFNFRLTAFVRLTTPIFPTMDNLHLETFFFFVPYRLVWTNWVKMMGEQDNPGDSISYSVPQCTGPANGYAVNSLHDYLGLPTVGGLGAGNTYTHDNLVPRAYNLIWNQWFRDENLQNSVTVDKGDGPDTHSNYNLLKRGKRKDYFTSALPWPQKGATSVSLPLGTRAPVLGIGKGDATFRTGPANSIRESNGTTLNYGNYARIDFTAPQDQFFVEEGGQTRGGTDNYPNIYADLTAATAATINQLRQAEQIQIVLERDARGGTRYTELLLSHFGVRSPDARLQRPEYLGGGSAPIMMTVVPQTSATGLTGGSAPLGNLAAVATANIKSHGFTQSFVEHGCVIGLMNVRADLTYQQGVRRLWHKRTRYDYYLPAFAQLGEQSILNKEIYAKGDANDDLVFGYQERWAEHRYHPSMITGLFRSTAANTIDPWHYAQNFTALPTLNNTFITENVPLQRTLAVGAGAAGKEFYFDGFLNIRATRPMPMFSVPSLATRF